MKPLWDDTDLATERKLFELSRRMPDGKHFDSIRDMVQTVTDMQLAEISRMYPRSTEHERRMRLASMWIEPELLRAAFGWEPNN
jgi:hypothetical protein